MCGYVIYSLIVKLNRCVILVNLKLTMLCSCFGIIVIIYKSVDIF